MPIQICLEPVKDQTCFAPLAVVGYCITRSHLLEPVWSLLDVKMKSYDHTPAEKLQDILVAIFAGCRSLAQVNTRLRPEHALAGAWKRRGFAEQSNLSRLLDRLDESNIDQLRSGNLSLLRKHSQLNTHNWEKPLVVDIDPTSLLTSKRSQASEKGWVSNHRNQYCRHVIRFMLAGYHENLLSVAYPGNRHGYEYCKPAIQRLLTDWSWSRQQRKQMIIRSDAEQGTDANVSYILWLGFDVLMKAYSGRRTQAWVKRTAQTAWSVDPNSQQRWATLAPDQLRLGRKLDAHLLRWLNRKQEFAHATLLSTLSAPVFDLWSIYDQRGAAETEIRADKSGLQLHLRRKHSLNAQEAWVILTDIAHNFIAWLCQWMLSGSAFETFGPKRLVHDLFCIPGHICLEKGRLTKVSLWENHPYASEMRVCLQNLLKTFDLG